MDSLASLLIPKLPSTPIERQHAKPIINSNRVFSVHLEACDSHSRERNAGPRTSQPRSRITHTQPTVPIHAAVADKKSQSGIVTGPRIIAKRTHSPALPNIFMNSYSSIVSNLEPPRRHKKDKRNIERTPPKNNDPRLNKGDRLATNPSATTRPF